MKLLILVIALLAGCDKINHDLNPPLDDWQVAPTQYVCTTEQMAKVETESKWCNANTSYRDTYCYGTAFIRNCTLRK